MRFAFLSDVLTRRAVIGLCALPAVLALTPASPPPHAATPPSAPTAYTAAHALPGEPPPAKHPGKQITKWFQDPVGNMAYRYRKEAGLDRAYGRNLAVGFVDITGLDDVDTTGYRVVDSAKLKDSDPKLYESLRLAERPQIGRFVIVPTFNNPSTQDTRGVHSEIRLLTQELLYMGVTDPARVFLLYSDLSPCADCGPRIPPNTEVRWMTKHGPGSLPRRERILTAAATMDHEAKMTDADRERVAAALAHTRAMVKEKLARRAQMKLDLWGKPTPKPCATPLAAPEAAAGPGLLADAAGRHVVAAECDEADAPHGETDRPTAPSGLARALAGPVAGTPGGIDFSSLELRYLADPGDGSGLQYSFEVPTTTGQTFPDAGSNAARLSSDAFFVWLSLKPSTFWVNLNPTEPDRVVDTEMGRTDVGRVMLEADLLLKKDVGRLIHPRTELGERYHDRLRGDCTSSRVWIVPAPAEVHIDDGKLYILNAPLKVRMESEYLRLDEGESELGNCPRQDDSTRDHNEALFRSLVLPELTYLVNTDPHYADLRRVYLARVAAQWYRDLDASRQTAYRDLVDRGDIDSWTTDTDWKPRDTFDRYVHSYTKGDYRYTREKTEGNRVYRYTYVYGGVDLTSVPMRELSDSSFAAHYPDLPKKVTSSLTRPAPGSRPNTLWLGAPTPQQRATGGDFAQGAGGSGPDASAGDDGPGGSSPGTTVAWVLSVSTPLLLLAAVVLWRRRRPSPSGPAAAAPRAADHTRTPYDDYL